MQRLVYSRCSRNAGWGRGRHGCLLPLSLCPNGTVGARTHHPLKTRLWEYYQKNHFGESWSQCRPLACSYKKSGIATQPPCLFKYCLWLLWTLPTKLKTLTLWPLTGKVCQLLLSLFNVGFWWKLHYVTPWFAGSRALVIRESWLQGPVVLSWLRGSCHTCCSMSWSCANPSSCLYCRLLRWGSVTGSWTILASGKPAAWML